MKKERGPLDCHQLRKIISAVFYGGIALLAVCWLLLSGNGSTVPVFLIVLCAIGAVGVFGGIMLAYACLRCPYCGASLMLGGRIPSRIPNFCPKCGKPL